MSRNLSIFAFSALTMILLALVAFRAQPGTSSNSEIPMFFGVPVVRSQGTPTTNAETARANAQATLNSSALTRSVALTQTVMRQTQMAATAEAEATLTQQNKDESAAATRTAVTDHIATQTQAATATATNTPTFGEMMKTHIVFYLIQPEKGRQDACGDIQLVPIVSKRMRSGDKLADVQVALQMLFNLKRKIYIQWYNALWDTGLTIDTYQYNAQKDYMTIHFAGYLPAGQLSNCDKHGIREQIWTTFFHYGIKEKTFKINGVFLIDELNRKTK